MNRMMKRTLALFLLVVLLVAACGSNDAPSSSDTPASTDAPAAGESGQQEDLIVTVFRAPT
jgi:ABC-type glycerol-3-phosphate transport system substrate-binding protein